MELKPIRANFTYNSYSLVSSAFSVPVFIALVLLHHLCPVKTVIFVSIFNCHHHQSLSPYRGFLSHSILIKVTGLKFKGKVLTSPRRSRWSRSSS